MSRIPMSPEVAIAVHNLRKEIPQWTWARIGTLFKKSDSWAKYIHDKYDSVTGLSLRQRKRCGPRGADQFDVVIEQYASTFRDTSGKEIAEAMARSGLKVSGQQVCRRLKALGFKKMLKDKVKRLPGIVSGNDQSDEVRELLSSDGTDLRMRHPRRIVEWVKVPETAKSRKAKARKRLREESAAAAAAIPEALPSLPDPISTPDPDSASCIKSPESNALTNGFSSSSAINDARNKYHSIKTTSPSKKFRGIVPKSTEHANPQKSQEVSVIWPDISSMPKFSFSPASISASATEQDIPGTAAFKLKYPFTTGFEINHFPEAVRNRITPDMLTRIGRASFAYLALHGVHVPAGQDVPPGERKLYIKVSGASEWSLLQAKTGIHKYCDGSLEPLPNSFTN